MCIRTQKELNFDFSISLNLIKYLVTNPKDDDIMTEI